ncbi:MAG: Rpn family recombination-promoting nuclease/putative transposase [Treponema sp.]|nr:Rpn family recombination-promoting nuclease/putative transposase [Candidatus Treponema equi]
MKNFKPLKEATFFSPVSDWGFKRIFGSEANRNLLRYLLNTIIDDKNIVEVTFLNTEHEYIAVEGGKSIFDVYCTCDDGSRIIVECQKSGNTNFKDRAFAYSAMAVMDQAVRHWEYNLDKLYFIGITTFNLFPGRQGYFTKAQIMDPETPGRVIYDNYLQIYVELSKFVSDDTELSSARDELLYVLRNLRNMDDIPEWVAARNDELTQICNTALMKDLSDKEKEECMSNEERERDYQQSIEQTANAKFKEGLEKGREEGIVEGESKKQLEIATAMKAQGISVQVISDCSGLSIETVKQL